METAASPSLSPGIRVLVCGGRKFTNYQSLVAALDHLNSTRGPFSVIIHGAARGADSFAHRWALERRIPYLPFPITSADWDSFANAGHARNEKMLVEGKPDIVVAFRGEGGTADMIRIARAAGVEVIEPLESSSAPAIGFSSNP